MQNKKVFNSRKSDLYDSAIIGEVPIDKKSYYADSSVNHIWSNLKPSMSSNPNKSLFE